MRPKKPSDSPGVSATFVAASAAAVRAAGAARHRRESDAVGKSLGVVDVVVLGVVVDSVVEHLVDVLVRGVLAAPLALGHFALFRHRGGSAAGAGQPP